MSKIFYAIYFKEDETGEWCDDPCPVLHPTHSDAVDYAEFVNRNKDDIGVTEFKIVPLIEDERLAAFL